MSLSSKGSGDGGALLRAVAVTGTSGKTSVCAFVQQALTALGVKAASVGSLGVVRPRGVAPRAWVGRGRGALPQALGRLAGEGVQVAAVEAYSAALARGLHDALPHSATPYAAAGFTGLSPDHHCVHGSVARYWAAKLRLVERVLVPGTPVVVQRAAPGAERFAAACRQHGMRAVLVGPGESIAVAPAPHAEGTARVRWGHAAEEAKVCFAEPFMLRNLEVALGLLRQLGVTRADALSALGALRLPPGRMERFRVAGGGPLVVVDFAHNEGALRAVLAALRPETPGRLVLVLGSKGGWGRQKRQAMGAVAARYADRVIVTDDDPRSEDPALIRAHLKAGCPGAAEVPRRARAVRQAVQQSAAADTVVVAGRGADPWFAGPRGRVRYSDLCVVRGLGGVAAARPGGNTSGPLAAS